MIRFENDRLKAIKIFDQLVESSDLIPTDDEICKEFLVRNKVKKKPENFEIDSDVISGNSGRDQPLREQSIWESRTIRKERIF